jgi:hypothetical protein
LRSEEINLAAPIDEEQEWNMSAADMNEKGKTRSGKGKGKGKDSI